MIDSYPDFERALSIPEERKAMGVALSDTQVRELLADGVSGPRLYSDWLRSSALRPAKNTRRVLRAWPWLAATALLLVVAAGGGWIGWTQLQHSLQTNQATHTVNQELGNGQ